MRCWFCVPVLLLVKINAMAQSPAEEIIAAIITERDVPVAFIEERMSPLLTQPLQLTGAVEFASDGTLSKRITAPFVEYISISADEVVLERDGRRRRVSMRRDTGLWRFYRSLRAMLGGDPEPVLAIYSAEVKTNGDEWVLELQPVASDSTSVPEGLMPMTVSGRGPHIQRVETRQGDDNWQIITFTERAAD